jgi:hypothetical protein
MEKVEGEDQRGLRQQTRWRVKALPQGRRASRVREMVQALSKGQNNCMNAHSRRPEAAVREMQRPRTVGQRQGYIRQMLGGTPRKVLG